MTLHVRGFFFAQLFLRQDLAIATKPAWCGAGTAKMMSAAQMLNEGVELAEAVSASWEAGNLAAAVRNITDWASQVRNAQTESPTESFQVLYLEANGDLRIDSTSFTTVAAATEKADDEASADPAWSLRAWILHSVNGRVEFVDAGTES